ncbi:ArnT family glycosyltransferase [Frateuria aurantia]
MGDPGLMTPAQASQFDPASVARQARRWRVRFFAVYIPLLLLKLVVACRLAPFPDEAFYWQESRHLAWGYADLPGMTAWLIHLGEGLFGHGLLAMRLPFLLLGAVLPWLVRDLAARVSAPAQAWQAALWCLALPLASSLGVLALPDVPLTVAMLLTICALARLGGTPSVGAWLAVGVGLAVAFCSHYRAAALVLIGLWLIVGTAVGRGWWRQPTAWGALLLAAAGLWPLVVSNWQLHGAGLGFQLWQRNPWRFHADALVQPLEQALVCTPLLYGWMAWAGWLAWTRRRGWVWQLVAVNAAVLWLGYAVAGLFADDTRFRMHWPLPAYLPLLAVLPVLWDQGRHGRLARGALVLGWLSGILATLAGLGWLAWAAVAPSPWAAGGGRIYPAPFRGWNQAALMMARLQRPGQVLVADNFILAAELEFAGDGTPPVYVMDSPLNTRHGRAPQLALWQRDLPALQLALAGHEALLAVDETALRERWRWPALEHLCGELATVRPLARLELDQGRRRFAFYAVRLVLPGGMVHDWRCPIWQQAHQAVYPAAPPATRT